MKQVTLQIKTVSLFQIPEEYRLMLAEISAACKRKDKKMSINACILCALQEYLDLPSNEQPSPKLPNAPLRSFTVRTSNEMKQNISYCAALWQIKSSFPVSMNAVVNTAILNYLQKIFKSYHPSFK